MTDESIFAAALAIPDPDQRADYLNHACAGNPDLRREVDDLLAAHAGESPLDRPPEFQIPTELTSDEPPPAEVGDQIGPYRLMEQIGEGGFGLVFVAEQHQPVRRKVALKVLKPGMDTRDVVARFEAERQALALMDHPNIAKVLDAGSTPNGRPYFVMELVKGIPINQYCDEQKLSTQERLALFAQVCQAVQHAHQKGIIHRDIKPTNVLVTVIDGKPVPKVIDFGVAKAVGQNLTERTIYTRFAQLVGTPLYMSPEQAQLSGVDVDTRSDIYSLGVLLYELLTGTTPFDSQRFRTAALEEIRRIIREEDPPRPSHRLSSLADTLPSISANRKSEPARLPGLIRGELDWIVMKCLEKDRDRRYETATGLARDVQRYLTGEAVEACPPTLGYRLRKAYRKHRGAVLTTLSFATVLLVATGVSTWLAIRAIESEKKAKSEYDERLAAIKREAEATARAEAANHERELIQKGWEFIFSRFSIYRTQNNNPAIQEVLKTACEHLEESADLTAEERSRIRDTIGSIYLVLNQYREAQSQFRQRYQELERDYGPDAAETRDAKIRYARATLKGRTSKQALAEAETIFRESYQRTHPSDISDLEHTLFYLGKWEELVELENEAIRDLTQGTTTTQVDPDALPRRQLRIAEVLMRSGGSLSLQARSLCEKAISAYRKSNGQDQTFGQFELASLDLQQGRYAAASGRFKKLTDQFPSKLYLRDGLALAALWNDDANLDLAGEQTQILIDQGRKEYGENHPDMRRYHWFRGWYYVLKGEKGEQGAYEKAEGELGKVFGPNFDYLNDSEGMWDHQHLCTANSLLGECVLHRPVQDFQKAEEYLLEAEKMFKEIPKPRGSPSRMRRDFRISHLQRLVDLYTAWEGHEEEAAQWKQKLDAEVKQALTDDSSQGASKASDDTPPLKAEHP